MSKPLQESATQPEVPLLLLPGK